jgi:flavin reductase (DIM6/NTAB) family NADH-FMN oxidoreductase RutF
MSMMPTSVSVLSCIETGLIHGCTISSIISISVAEESPQVLFVLQKNSLIGSKIKTLKFFSINVLNEFQVSSAKKYSTKRFPDLASDSDWSVKDRFVTLNSSLVVFNCEFLTLHETNFSEIFVANVIHSFADSKQTPLIYHARKYHGLDIL